MSILFHLSGLYSLHMFHLFLGSATEMPHNVRDEESPGTCICYQCPVCVARRDGSYVSLPSFSEQGGSLRGRSCRQRYRSAQY